MQVSWLLAAAQDAAAHSADLSASTVINIASGIAATLCGVVVVLWRLDRTTLKDQIADLKADIAGYKSALKDAAFEAQKLINKNDEQTDRIEELVEELSLERQGAVALRARLERYEPPQSDAAPGRTSGDRITGSFGKRRRG